MAMMYRIDFGKPIEADIGAAIAYIKSQPDVFPEQVGVTGFCLGGGLTFLTDCKFSDEIAAAAPFYGMVLDQWIEAMSSIAVPIYLFHGGIDPFIPLERVQQIESRFKELNTFGLANYITRLTDLVDGQIFYPSSPHPFSHRGRRGARGKVLARSPSPALGEGYSPKGIQERGVACFCAAVGDRSFVSQSAN